MFYKHNVSFSECNSKILRFFPHRGRNSRRKADRTWVAAQLFPVTIDSPNEVPYENDGNVFQRCKANYVIM